MAIEAIIGTAAATSGVSAWLARRLTSKAMRRHVNRGAHEIRRPLQALALTEGNAPAPFSYARTRAELVGQALDALGELDCLVNGAAPSSKRELVRVRDVVAARLDALPVLAEANGVRCHWEAGSVMVQGNRIELSRALDNVLVNAFEHGSPPIVVTGARVGDRLRITVADSGAGGWERPRRSDPRHGHGLAIARSVFTSHGGRLVRSSEGRGSVVAMDLPIARSGGIGSE